MLIEALLIGGTAKALYNGNKALNMERLLQKNTKHNSLLNRKNNLQTRDLKMLPKRKELL